MTRTIPLLAVSSALLSACGGGGGGGVNDAVTFASLVERSIAYDDAAELDFDDEPVPTLFSDLPPSGEVFYEGVANISDVRTTTVIEGGGTTTTTESIITFAAIGSVTATIDFSTTAFSIDAGNFFQLDVDLLNDEEAPDISDVSELSLGPVNGTLTINMTRDVMNENSYRAEAMGSITAIDGTVRTIDEAGFGFFTGNDAAALFVAAFDEVDRTGDPDGTYIDDRTSAGANLVRQ